MFKVEVTTAEFYVRQGVGKTSGKPYKFHEQKCWLFVPGWPYPKELKLTLNPEDPIYDIGEYRLDPASFDVGRYGDLVVRPKLMKVGDSKLAKVS